MYEHFVRNQTDVLYFSFQAKHGWPKTIVRPHIHVIPATAVVGADATFIGNAYFLFRWYWTGIGTELKVPDVVAQQNLTLPITIGDQMEELVLGPEITPPAEVGPSSHLHVEMSRLGTNVLDTFDADAANGTAAANLAFVSDDCHMQLKATGTKFEYSN